MKLTNEELALKRWLNHEKNQWINSYLPELMQFPKIKPIPVSEFNEFIERYLKLTNEAQ